MRADQQFKVKTPGQIAYEAYAGASGWRSLVSGERLMQWTNIGPKCRDAWESAATAVLEVER